MMTRHPVLIFASFRDKLPHPLHLAAIAEVVHDDRNGQGDNNHSAKDASNGNDLPKRWFWACLVHARAGRSHGQRCPPERVIGRPDVSPSREQVDLGEVNQLGESYDSDAEEQQQQSKFFGTFAQGHPKNPEVLQVTGQLQNDQDSNVVEELEGGIQCWGVLIAFRFEPNDGQDVVQDEEQVDDVQDSGEEFALAGCKGEPQDVFQSEPPHANDFHDGWNEAVFVVLKEVEVGVHVEQGKEAGCDDGWYRKHPKYLEL